MSDPDETLRQAEAAERAAFAAIAALGQREIADIKAWTASGCEGEQPRPDMEARKRLATELNVAVAAREAAEKSAMAKGS